MTRPIPKLVITPISVCLSFAQTALNDCLAMTAYCTDDVSDRFEHLIVRSSLSNTVFAAIADAIAPFAVFDRGESPHGVINRIVEWIDRVETLASISGESADVTAMRDITLIRADTVVRTASPEEVLE